MTNITCPTTGYYQENLCQLSDFKAIIRQNIDMAALNFADHIENNIPIYNIQTLMPKLLDRKFRQAIMAEWAYILQKSSGVLVFKHAYKDLSSIDAASKIFAEIIEREKHKGGADHFAKAGNNDRIWNSLQKLCHHSPQVFIEYFSNIAVNAISEAWLGPNFQMTSQVNLVRPGGEAQMVHRDYHLGFQTAKVSGEYPAHVHQLSPVLTLQGAIAHTDMPIESGPTKFLPFSQLYDAGYMAWRRDDFRDYFEQNYVQLPLEKGDAVFFNPALFHAAGDNISTDIDRMVNLLQVSSAFGRAMETIDRHAMLKKLYPAFKKIKSEHALTDAEIDAAIACCAEGYAFPTNLDTDPPVGGLAPQSANEIIKIALQEGWSSSVFDNKLDAAEKKKQA